MSLDKISAVRKAARDATREAINAAIDDAVDNTTDVAIWDATQHIMTNSIGSIIKEVINELG